MLPLNISMCEWMCVHCSLRLVPVLPMHFFAFRAIFRGWAAGVSVPLSSPGGTCALTSFPMNRGISHDT